MEVDQPSLLRRLARRIVPPGTYFYALLVEQVAVVHEGTASLVQFMESGDAEAAKRVRALERQGDRVKARNLQLLNEAFSTPMDREDISRAITTLDTILNYAKSTVIEMAELNLPPDEHTRAMARWLQSGTDALCRGFSDLEQDPEAADAAAEVARKTERKTEKIYRAALAELFDAQHYLNTLTPAQRAQAAAIGVLLEPLDSEQSRAVATGVSFVVEIMKRREVYRHMSNAADRVALAGEVLHDIVVKAV